MHHFAKIHGDQSNRCPDMAIFQFFKIAVRRVDRVELRHRAKFRGDR